MFHLKCKQCGGTLISVSTIVDIETNGGVKKVKNVPAKRCSECGHILVDHMTMEQAKEYARTHATDTIDDEMCEAETLIMFQTLFM